MKKASINKLYGSQIYKKKSFKLCYNLDLFPEPDQGLSIIRIRIHLDRNTIDLNLASTSLKDFGSLIRIYAPHDKIQIQLKKQDGSEKEPGPPHFSLQLQNLISWY